MTKPDRLLNTTLAATLLAAVVAIVTGCNNNQVDVAPNAPNSPRPVTSAPSANPLPTDATRLKAGPAPLTYMLGPGGPIRVIDATTGKTVAQTLAPQQAIITLDETKGISVSNKIIKPGPLPPGRRYELWLERK